MFYKLVIFYSLTTFILLPSLLAYNKAQQSVIENSFGNNANFDRYPSTITINVTDYPLAKRDEYCNENIFNKKIKCPYRHLESLTNTKSVDYIIRLNTMTTNILNKNSFRKSIKKTLEHNLKFNRFTSFAKYGDYFYHFFNSGNQTYNVLKRRATINSKSVTYFDMNVIYPKGDTLLNGFCFSNDGKIMAYAVSQKNSPINTIYFINDKGKLIKNKISKAVISSITFAFKGKGFFYATYKNIRKNNEANKNLNNLKHYLYYHVVNTSDANDVLVATSLTEKNEMIQAHVSNDEKFLFVKYFDKKEPDSNTIYFVDLSKFTNEKITKKFDLKPLVINFKGVYTIIDSNKNDIIAAVFTKNSTEGQVIKRKLSLPPNSRGANSVLIKKDPKKTLKTILAIGRDFLFALYVYNTKNFLYVFNKNTGKLISEIEPLIFQIISVSGNTQSNFVFITVQTFISQQELYTCDLSMLKKAKTKLYLKPIFNNAVQGIERNHFIMKEIFYHNNNGIKVPMYLFFNKNTKLDGKNPVLLEGFGGFGYSISPQYDALLMAFVKNLRGIYVVVGIRGGSEYGKQWHENGMLLKKKNCFDDFIDAAQYLIKQRYTQPSKLSIRGSTNGGLLAAVVAQQRPDLFSSVVVQNAILDMLRYNKIANGEVWLKEYGDPNNQTEFLNLLSYSPLHNIRMTRKPFQKPSMLLLADYPKDNFLGAHTLKYAATLLYSIQKGIYFQTNPILTKFIMPLQNPYLISYSERLEELIDILVFLKETLNLKWYN